jgi:hypothetical protein
MMTTKKSMFWVKGLLGINTREILGGQSGMSLLSKIQAMKFVRCVSEVLNLIVMLLEMERVLAAVLMESLFKTLLAMGTSNRQIFLPGLKRKRSQV